MTESSASRSAWRILVPAALVETAFLALLGWWPGARSPWVALLIFAGAFVAYAVAASRILDDVGGGVLIWVFAVLMRLVMLPLTPALSHDIYRHLWDGHVQLAGINPFLYAPSNATFAQMHGPWFALIPHPSLLTPYSPVAQLAFFAVAAAGGAILQAKLLWLGFDLATGWLLGRVAAFTGRSRRLTQLLYLWSPLLLVEVAWNGHVVPLATFSVVLVILLARAAPGSSGGAGALAAFTMPPTLVALPALVRRLGVRFLGGFILVAVAFCLPYARGWRHLFTGAMARLATTRVMAGPFLLFESVIPSQKAAFAVVGAILVGLAVWLAVRRCRPERALFWALGATLILAPTLRPWVVLWILPLAALRVSRPWLLMTGLAFAGYLEIRPDAAAVPWSHVVAARLLVWGPLLIWLAVDGARLWRERVPPLPTPPGSPGSTPPR